MTAKEFVSRLDGVKKTTTGWQSRCPAHEDKNPSLSISEGEDGRVLLKCHAGCETADICAKIGLTLADLMPPRDSGNGKLKLVKAYDYTNVAGKLAFQVCRFTPKDFRQRRPDPDHPGEWIWNLHGVQRVLYKLPQVLAAMKRGLPIIVAEGEKDCDALTAQGLTATCNPGGAAKEPRAGGQPSKKWLDSYSETLAGADCYIIADKDQAGRRHAQFIAASLRGKAKSVHVLELPDIDGKPVKDASDFFGVGGTVQTLQAILDAGEPWTPSQRDQETTPTPRSNSVSDIRADPRPAIRLPGDGRLLSDFGSELGYHLSSANIFTRGGLVLTVNERQDGFRRILPEELRTWIEKHLVCFKEFRPQQGPLLAVRRTMAEGDAKGVICSPQLHEQLRPVEAFGPVRMPVRRATGAIELLAPGYDAEARTFTASAPEPPDLSIEEAKRLLDDLLAEFPFADSGRSRAVAASAMFTLYARGLLPRGSLRPCFIYLGNAEGCGKTLLCKCAIVPVIGYAPTGCRPKDEDEMRKFLLAATIEARQAILFDNVRGHLQSEALEAFLSAETFSDRVLGKSLNFSGDASAVVFITGNGATVSPDLRRRALFAELFLECERAEDRIFKTELTVPVLLERRQPILGALWRLTRSWYEAGEPAPSRSHASFPQWARTIAAIVEHAGFGCPLDTEVGGGLIIL